MQRFEVRPHLARVGAVRCVGEEGAVEEVEVDVFHAEVLEGEVEAADGVVDAWPQLAFVSWETLGEGGGGDFGGDEELGPRDPGFADCYPELFFVVVGFGAVEVAVAEA